MKPTINELLQKLTGDRPDIQQEYAELISDLLTKVADKEDHLEGTWVDVATDIKAWMHINLLAAVTADTQKTALTVAEDWVSKNLSNASLVNRITTVLWFYGIDVGVEKILRKIPGYDSSKKLSLSLELNVAYLLNGAIPSALIQRLQDVINTACEDGTLTENTAAKLALHSISVSTVATIESSDFMLLDEESTTLEDEIYREDLDNFASVIMARKIMEDGKIVPAFSHLQADAERIKVYSKPLYDLLMKY